MKEETARAGNQFRMALQPEIQKKRRVQGGIATSDVTLSAHVSGNADGFAQILRLHVPEGAIVADVTWGKGVFWQKVREGTYDVRATDIAMGVDCRELPYSDGEIDCVVLDPPYMEGFFRNHASQKAGGGSYSGVPGTLRQRQ